MYYVYVNPFKQSGVSVLGGPLSVLQSLATLGDPTAARILLNTTKDFVGCSNGDGKHRMSPCRNPRHRHQCRPSPWVRASANHPEKNRCFQPALRHLSMRLTQRTLHRLTRGLIRRSGKNGMTISETTKKDDFHHQMGKSYPWLLWRRTDY